MDLTADVIGRSGDIALSLILALIAIGIIGGSLWQIFRK